MPNYMHLIIRRSRVSVDDIVQITHANVHIPVNTTRGVAHRSLIRPFCVWANYSDLSRGHPKRWFSKGISEVSLGHRGRLVSQWPTRPTNHAT